MKCKKCAHIGKADDYEPGDFTKVCLYDSKPSATNGYKRHAETAYLSCLADCKRADNELEMIRLKKDELVIKKAEQERANIEKNKKIEADFRLEEKRLNAQEHFFKMQLDTTAVIQQMQLDTTAAMKEMLQTVLPKKSALEKFREQKAAIATLLASGDITSDMASQLMDKLNSELLYSSLI